MKKKQIKVRLLFRVCCRCYAAATSLSRPFYLHRFFFTLVRVFSCLTYLCVACLHAVHPLMRATESEKRLSKKNEGENEYTKPNERASE